MAAKKGKKRAGSSGSGSTLTFEAPDAASAKQLIKMLKEQGESAEAMLQGRCVPASKQGRQCVTVEVTLAIKPKKK